MVSSELAGILAPYVSVHGVITRPVSNFSAMFLVYGIYTVIFGLSIHALSRHNSSTIKFYMGCTISLFILGTLYTVAETWGLTRQVVIQFNAATTRDFFPLLAYINGDTRGNAWLAITTLASSLMNAIATAILIHRCYVVWSFSKVVLCPLVFVAFILDGMDLGCVIAAIVGFGHITEHNNFTLAAKAQSIDFKVVNCILVFQLVLAFITGGRIWWISQKARKLVGKIAQSRYNRIVATVIESGLLYASTLLARFIFTLVVNPGASSIVSFDPTQLAILMSGLAPTLILVQVGYGKSVDSVQQMVSTIQLINTQGNQQRRSGAPSRATTIDLPLQLAGEGSIIYPGAYRKTELVGLAI